MSFHCDCRESSACVYCFDSVCVTHSCLMKKDYFLNQHRPVLCQIELYQSQESRASLQKSINAERQRRSRELAVQCSCGALASFVHYYTYCAYCSNCKPPGALCIYIEGLSPSDFKRHIEFWFNAYCRERNWPNDDQADTDDPPVTVLQRKQSVVFYNRRNYELPLYRCSMSDCDSTTADSEMAAIVRNGSETTHYCLHHTQLTNIQSIAGSSLLCEYKREMLFSNIDLRKAFRVLFFEDPASEYYRDSEGNQTSCTLNYAFACSQNAKVTGICFAVLVPGIELVVLENLVVNGQQIDFDLRTKQHSKIKACFPPLSDSARWEVSVKMCLYASSSQRHAVLKQRDALYIGSDGSIWAWERKTQFPVQVMELEYQCCSTS